jgi:hypothetical protein
VEVVEEGGEQLHPVWLHGRVQQPPQLVDRSLPLLQGELVQHPIEVVGVHGRSLLLEPLIKLLSRQPTARPNRGAILARQQPGRRGGAGAEHGATVAPISSFFPGFVPRCLLDWVEPDRSVQGYGGAM